MAVYPARPSKVAPLHPGRIIASTLKDLRMSTATAGRRMGISGMALGNVINGKSPVTVPMALRIGKFFGNGPELWLNMQQAYDLWHYRRKLADALKKIETVPHD
jgi:addiction module HigA family antidote